MARYLKISDDVKKSIVQEFIDAVMKHKASDGDIKFTKSFGKVDQKTTLKFTANAYYKMLSLVDKFSSEIAWHGVTERMEGGGYLIKDIIVYPQVVTGATVTTDQEEYQNWLINQFEKGHEIKMQGHSHVNMGVTPSGTDTSLYDGILSGLDDDDYYIFLIWNKKNQRTIMIYDNAINMYFEGSDVSIVIGEGVEELLEEANKVVKKSTPAPTKSTYGYGCGYTGGYSSYGKQNQKPKTDSKDDTKKTKQTTSVSVVSTAKKTKSGNFKKKKEDTKKSGYSWYDEDDYDYEAWYYGRGYYN